jgi:hypothetical protein
VLGEEPVHQPPRGPPGERTGDRGGCVAGREGREVERVRPAFRAGQEHRAQLRGSRAGHEHGGHVRAARQPAGRHERHVHRCRHLAQQRDQAGVVDAGVVEATPVGAGFLALHAEPVGTGGDGLTGLGRGGDGHEHLGAVPLHLGDDLGRRAAEREADDRHVCLGQQRELGFPVVVPANRITERNAVPLDFGGQNARVRGDGPRVHCGALGREHVEPERPPGQLPGLGDLVPHRVRAQVAGGEKPEATGVRHGGHQLRRRPATGHRRLHDRLRQLVKDRHLSELHRWWRRAQGVFPHVGTGRQRGSSAPLPASGLWCCCFP